MGFPFMQGQLMYVAEDYITGAADGTFSTTAAFYSLRNGDGPANYLQLAEYTPAKNGYALIFMGVQMKSNTAGQDIALRVYEVNSSTAITPMVNISFSTANDWLWAPVPLRYTLTANTAVLFRGEIYLYNAGTVTVDRNATHMRIEAYANP